jgi:predicted phosphodiesterase
VRVAALYDVHGNLPAREAVLADVARAGVDRVVVGGDVVPGPMPRECVERLLALDVPTDFVMGNGDREVLAELTGAGSSVPEAYREVMRWNAERLGPAHAPTLEAWWRTVRVDVPGVGDTLFCHATPRSDTEIFTRRTPDDRLRALLGDVDAAVVVCGHTHMQHDRTLGSVRVVNAGSVGMPFGEPGAYWLLLGPGVELRRTDYDLDAAAARVRATDYPQAEAFAAGNVLRPPTEDAMLAAFAGAARA